MGRKHIPAHVRLGFASKSLGVIGSMGAAMSRWVMTTLTCALAIMASLADVEAASGAAALSYRVERNEFDVSTGAIQEQPGRGLAIEVPEVRAVLRVRTAQAAALHFTYLGPTAGS